MKEQKLTDKLKRNIKLDYFSTFLGNINMQSSIWVLYLAYCGMNLLQIGLLEGIYHATSIICEIPSGAMADLLGRRKTMILSRICIAISCVIMLFSRSFWLFALSFIVQAFGNNCNSGSEEALVYDSMKLLGKEEEYIRLNGRLNVIMEVAQALATVAGGVLAEYSFLWCYAACVVIAALALLPVLFMTEPPIHSGDKRVSGEAGRKVSEEDPDVTKKNTVSDGKAAPWQVVVRHFQASARILTSDRRILNIVIYYSCIFASYTLLFFYSQQYFSDMGLNKIEISFIMLLAGGIDCLGALCSAKLFILLDTKLAKLGAGVIAVCIACYGLGKLPITISVFLVAGFFNSALYPVQSNCLNRLIPSEQRATLISVNSMAFSVAMIAAFPAVGALADRLGLMTVFAGLGVLLLFLTVLTGKVKVK